MTTSPVKSFIKVQEDKQLYQGLKIKQESSVFIALPYEIFTFSLGGAHVLNCRDESYS